jgi:hypothetical protein
MGSVQHLVKNFAPTSVVYIAGSGRSGSTLVGSVLGLDADHVFVGELRGAWHEGLAQNLDCGCGQPFRECPFWTQVFQRAFGGFDTPETRAFAALIGRMDRLPDSLRLFWLALRFPLGHGVGEDYAVPLAKFYRAIREVSGKRVVVDSSKSLRYAAILAAIPSLRLAMTNIVRDPRGIIYSRQRRALTRDGGDRNQVTKSRRMRIFYTLHKWAVRNALAARVIRRDGGIRLLYEDFVQDQGWYQRAVLGDEAVARVACMLGEGIPEDMVQHQIGGNWVRNLKISPDEKWRAELPALPRFLVGALSAPLRAIYRSRIYCGT